MGISLGRLRIGHLIEVDIQPALNIYINRALTRPYRGRLTAPSQLKLAEYFPKGLPKISKSHKIEK